MASKKKTVEEMFADITAQLTNLTPLVDSVRKLTDTVTDIEKKLNELSKEHKQLKLELDERDNTISSLKEQLNQAQQHNRQWSIRVIGMSIPEPDRNNNLKVKQNLYRNVLLPILEGAVSKGDISDIPSCDQLIERAHVLPSPPNKPPSVIARFYCRDFIDLIFKHKREFQPTAAQPITTRASQHSSSRPRPLYPIYEDLTRASFTKLRALSSHEAVHAAWSSSGIIKFRLKSNSEVIHKVKNVHDPVSTILDKITS